MPSDTKTANASSLPTSKSGSPLPTDGPENAKSWTGSPSSHKNWTPMPDIRTSAYAAGQGRQYLPYDGLAPSQKEYIHTTLDYLDLESTPQRRDNLAYMLNDGTWKEHTR